MTGIFLLGRRLAVSISLLNRIEVIGVLSLRLPLLLGVDRCDIGGWFGVRRHQAGLFAVADEVLQVLYCAHGGGRRNVR